MMAMIRDVLFSILVIVVGLLPAIVGYFVFGALGAGTFWESIAALGLIVYVLGSIQVVFLIAAISFLYYYWSGR